MRPAWAIVAALLVVGLAPLSSAMPAGGDLRSWGSVAYPDGTEVSGAPLVWSTLGADTRRGVEATFESARVTYYEMPFIGAAGTLALTRATYRSWDATSLKIELVNAVPGLIVSELAPDATARLTTMGPSSFSCPFETNATRPSVGSGDNRRPTSSDYTWTVSEPHCTLRSTGQLEADGDFWVKIISGRVRLTSDQNRTEWETHDSAGSVGPATARWLYVEGTGGHLEARAVEKPFTFITSKGAQVAWKGLTKFSDAEGTLDFGGTRVTVPRGPIDLTGEANATVTARDGTARVQFASADLAVPPQFRPSAATTAVPSGQTTWWPMLLMGAAVGAGGVAVLTRRRRAQATIIRAPPVLHPIAQFDPWEIARFARMDAQAAEALLAFYEDALDAAESDGEWESAIEICRAARHVAPHLADLAVREGMYLADIDELERAFATFDEAMLLADDPGVHLLVATTAMRFGRASDALDAIGSLLQGQPEAVDDIMSNEAFMPLRSDPRFIESVAAARAALSGLP